MNTTLVLHLNILIEMRSLLLALVQKVISKCPRGKALTSGHHPLMLVAFTNPAILKPPNVP